jgi:hypothetical protein
MKFMHRSIISKDTSYSFTLHGYHNIHPKSPSHSSHTIPFTNPINPSNPHNRPPPLVIPNLITPPEPQLNERVERRNEKRSFPTPATARAKSKLVFPLFSTHTHSSISGFLKYLTPHAFLSNCVKLSQQNRNNLTEIEKHKNEKQKVTRWYLGIARQGIYPASVLHNDFRK